VAERTATREPPREETPPSTTALAPAERTPWYRAIVLPLLAVISALVLGAILIVFTDSEALYWWARFFRHPVTALSTSFGVVRDAYYALFSGAFGSPSTIAHAIGSGELSQIQSALSPLSETIVTATPLILVGLSVALGFRGGLFNIGAEGQMNVGALAASAAGFTLTWLPGPIHLVVVILAGFLGGAVWGGVPGWLKAKTGAHEVITTIMLNFVAVGLVLYMLGTSLFKQQAEPVAKPVVVAFPHLFGTSLRVHLGIAFALAVAIGVGWVLNRTTLGFELRAVGANPDAARAAGMDPSRTTVAAMAAAGGLAGLAGANQLLSVTPSLLPGFASGLGFDGIAIALLGRARPGGVVAAAFLFGALRTGGRSMQAITQTPIDIITVIQALVIAFVAAPSLVRAIYRIRARRVVGSETFTKGWAG
jgi:simple sugar transport system permease protein